MKKGVLFLCPDTVMLIREREEKIMKKGHCGKMLLLFGAACRLPRLLTQQGLTTIERVDDAG